MKKILVPSALVLAASLSACNTAPKPVVEPAPVLSISGSAPAVAGRSLTLIASDGLALGTAVTVAADGKFMAALPVPEKARLKSVTMALSGLLCTVATPLSSSDAGAAGLGVASAQVDTTSLLAATVNHGLLSRHVEIHAWIYSDLATTLTGKLDCAQATGGAISTLPVTINASLAAGWTPVVATIDANLGLGGLSGSGTVSTAADYNGGWLTMTELANQVKP